MDEGCPAERVSGISAAEDLDSVMEGLGGRGSVRHSTGGKGGVNAVGDLVSRVTTDIDRKPRGAHPDLGAHEFDAAAREP